MADIILTWPKKRTLESYLEALEEAERTNQGICFKVAVMPALCKVGDKAFMVHDGAIRGWNKILGFSDSPDMLVTDPITNEPWEGKFIVRDPAWNAIEPLEHPGFRGFRYTKTNPEILHALDQENIVKS